jgi:nicotinate-nucleotide pyrophosphorylase (carboxylating)
VERLQSKEICRLISLALEEDIGTGDATTLATIPADKVGSAVIRMGESGILAGLALAEEVFQQLDPSFQFQRKAADRQSLSAGETILKIQGPARALLAGERTALNFLQRLSGIATLTSHFVEAVQDTGAVIFDTRKTTPGWRMIEKYAVTCGGGQNHRMGLYDRVMIKDNHLAMLAGEFSKPMVEAVARARRKFPDLKVEVEADTLDQVVEALEAKVDVVLLDNMNLDELRQAVVLVKNRCQTEASGGVSLETVRTIAETGVDFISVGALTHSARAMDINMEIMIESPVKSS